MADYESGAITFSGLGSGTDFNSIVDQLKKVESIQLNRLKNWKSDWNERYIAFGDIISTVRDAKSQLADLNSPSKFLKKTGTSTKENVLTVTATADAVDGSHKVNVKQLASNAIWASTQTYSGKNANFNTTGAQQDFTYIYKGKKHTVKIPAGTTLEAFANIVNKDRNNPGVNVSLVQVKGGYTFQVQGTESGAAADLSILPTRLGGMGDGAQATSTWTSNAPIADADLTKNLSDMGNAAEAQTYEITRSGNLAPITVTIDGNATKKDLVTEINKKAGKDIASFVDGKLQIAEAEKVEITSGTPPVKKTEGTPSTEITFTGKLADTIGLPGDIYKFSVTKGADTKTFEVKGDDTFSTLKSKLAEEGYSVTTKGDDAKGYTWTIAGVSKVDITGGTQKKLTSTSKVTWPQAGTENDPVQAGVIPKKLTYTFTMANGTQKTVTVDDSTNTTMQQLVGKINAELAAGGGTGTAAIERDADGNNILKLNNVYSAAGQGISGQVTESGSWVIQRASDALFTVDNWPHEMVSSSNNVTDVLEGVTLTLKDVGETQISVAADLNSVRDNIQIFLDTINTVVKKVQDLTRVDGEKAVASYDKEDSNYSASQWDQEQGSLLTGNYGVQLFNTRMKSLMSSSATGFTKITGNDLLSGDFVTALSQMGIKTDSEEGSPTYGMFCIAPSSSNAEMQQMDLKRFEDALSNNLNDVISLFAADDEGSTTSADFRYAQHIKGMTVAGSYPVEYTVVDGKIQDVFINGHKASQSDLDDKSFTVANAGDASGISIVIDNLEPGTHKGNVSIKQGKVRQMEDFFTKELIYHQPNVNDPTISENNGALMILQANYKQIMDNAEKKIQQEQDRISRWERTQRLAFARLETLLGQYQQNQASLASQLKQFE